MGAAGRGWVEVWMVVDEWAGKEALLIAFALLTAAASCIAWISERSRVAAASCGTSRSALVSDSFPGLIAAKWGKWAGVWWLLLSGSGRGDGADVADGSAAV